MRNAFYNELETVFAADERLVFITGDLGYKLFDPLTALAPDRVFNAGIREAAMIGFAAGLARAGLLPFVYSIVPFVTLRCFEQIKLDVCYNHNKVVLVGVGGGVAYGPNGSTHHGVDDIGALSCLPCMTIMTPADPGDVRVCVREAINSAGPVYIRLGRNGEPDLLPPAENHDITQPRLVRRGPHGLMIACGFILREVLAAADLLAARGLHPSVAQVTVLRPFPRDFFAAALADGAPVLTVEEHVPAAGLGLETARLIAELRSGNPFAMRHLPAAFPGACGDRDSALSAAGLDPAALAACFEGLAVS